MYFSYNRPVIHHRPQTPPLSVKIYRSLPLLYVIVLFWIN
ncbi:hypothetical protein MICA_283 [Micavibrio aeruginosavorus ARL-13]|uniref:Uncharacterized protein n=1 Tax=Micavibrio aeruginosavorus (strain ARL-13) TaxID=856793 RepID=G2KQ86_MICAA|nr:hypothetical protein MICA_283 [Micavibrio aeruginosavorus ARL-13]